MNHDETYREIKQEIREVKATLKEVRDRVLTFHECPSPGECLLLRKQNEDQERRLRALEKANQKLAGAFILSHVMLGVVITLIVKYT